jgi:hypothetical protein
LPYHQTHDEEIKSLINAARMQNMGVQLYGEDTIAQLGQSASINVWIHEQSPEWDLSMDLGNMDLALLTAFKLKANWKADLRIITVVEEPQVEVAYRYLDNLCDLARLKDVKTHVEIGSFQEALGSSPQADVDILGLPEDPNLNNLRLYIELTKSACVFVADSGRENILA